MRALNLKVLIKGAGEMASGVAASLYRAHFYVCLTELSSPLAVRRSVCFSEAVHEKEAYVEGIEARLTHDLSGVFELWAKNVIPVLVDPQCQIRAKLQPDVLVDAIMGKENTGTRLQDAPLVIALGPGFSAGEDCHFVIETKRGRYLGRVIDKGPAEPNTGIPGEVGGYTLERVLRSPCDGYFHSEKKIGDKVKQGEIIGKVNGEPVIALIDGAIRGLIMPGTRIAASVKIGDIAPRSAQEGFDMISDKARAIGGGVLEAILRRFNY